VLASKPGTDSATVGTAGSACERRGGHRQRTHRAGLDGLDRFGQRTEHDLHLPADQVGERRRAAAIRHMQHVNMGHQLEQLAADMRHASAAARRHADLARVRFGIGDEFRDRLGRQRGSHLHHQGQATDHRDRNDIADEIEAEGLVQRRIGRHRLGYQEQRVAVRRRAHDRLDADIGARTGPVLDDEGLPQPLRQARKDVEGSAGSDGHDETHRPRGIGLRTRHSRNRG
jgi:hypothetical protein